MKHIQAQIEVFASSIIYRCELRQNDFKDVSNIKYSCCSFKQKRISARNPNLVNSAQLFQINNKYKYISYVYIAYIYYFKTKHKAMLTKVLFFLKYPRYKFIVNFSLVAAARDVMKTKLAKLVHKYGLKSEMP